DKHRSVDDAPFGGGPGMVLRPDVLDAAIVGAGGVGPLILLSPRGRPLGPQRVRELAACTGGRLLGGRLARVADRVIEARRAGTGVPICGAAMAPDKKRHGKRTRDEHATAARS